MSRVVLAGTGAAFVAALVLGIGSFLRDRRILSLIFGQWSSEQVLKISDGVYRLSFTDPQFSWSRRRVRVDSIMLTTDTVALAAKHDSLPRMHVLFQNCQLTGVQLVPLALGRGLNASRFGCDRADVAVQIPPVRAKVRPDSARRAQPFMVITRQIELPDRVPAIRVANVGFPETRLSLAQRRYSGKQVDLSLVLEWQLRGVNIDPTDLAAISRPLFSEHFTLAADSVRFRLEPRIETRIGRLEVSVTDSTLVVENFAHGPTVTDEEVTRTEKFRITRIRASARRLKYSGVDLTQLAEGNGLSMRKLEADSAVLDVMSDKRLPAGPKRVNRLTPQEWVSELDRGLAVDTVIIRDGTIVYRERHPDREAPGVLIFDGVNGIATNVRHDPGRRERNDPMRIHVTTRLMNEALVQANFTVPLDAPDFTLSVEGHVGPMDVTGMNRFMQRVAPVKIKSGHVDSVAFQVAVTNGVARGTVTPLYGDLTIDVTGTGMDGVLGKKNVLGSLARGIASLAVNEFGVRRSNPEGGNEPVAGQVAHTFTPDETLPDFLWKGIRGGLVEVIRKR